MHGGGQISQHLRTFEPGLAPSPEKRKALPHPTATDIMTLMRGQVSLFPQFEALGKWLSSMSNDELNEMYQDIEEKAHG
jgi:hypothetical protein